MHFRCHIVNSVVLSSYVPGCLRIPSPVLELTAHLMETRQAVLPSLNNCTDSKLSQNVAITHHTLYLELAFSLTSPSVCFMLTTDIWSSLSSRVFKEKFFTSPLGSFTNINWPCICEFTSVLSIILHVCVLCHYHSFDFYCLLAYLKLEGGMPPTLLFFSQKVFEYSGSSVVPYES